MRFAQHFRVGLVAVALCAAPAFAGTTSFSYQGFITHGVTPVSQPIDLTISLYDVPTLGTALGSNFFDDQPVHDGLVMVELDYGSQFFDGRELWLQLNVNGADLNPRQPLLSTPYAMHALNAPFFMNGSHICYTGGNLGIGTDTPDVPVHVSSGTDVSLADGGYMVVGPVTGKNIGFDNNEIMARDNGAESKLYLNHDGGIVTIGGASGSLGVRTTEPTEALTVSGNVKVTGWIGTDAFALVSFHTWGQEALRLHPGIVAPNIIGGYHGNGIGVSVDGATISGGGMFDYENTVNADHGTIGGGRENVVSGQYGTIAGGRRHTLTGDNAVIAGGYKNTASDNAAAVGGGYDNQATGHRSAIGGGQGNVASGRYSTVPGGVGNEATADSSFAAGNSAWANREGSFVWSDTSAGYCESTADNQFMARASGGYVFFTNADMTSGAILHPGAYAWSPQSDRAMKENLADVDGRAILRDVAAMPVYTWNYKSQDPSIRHIGPTAQDFRAAFGVGEDSKHISTVDADGVALAAIKGLHETTLEMSEVIERQQSRIDALEARLAKLENRETEGGAR
ncbi:MAG: hypothetical protein GY715_15300 [Planctomycetes bacterium]|nr:hypothetical protein [Planctomycetota bacterium]